MTLREPVGKAYAHRRANGPIGDFFSTPKSLVWVAEQIIVEEFTRESEILEPCSGLSAISEELTNLGYSIVENDLHLMDAGVDYLTAEHLITYRQLITNPPFSLWNRFVARAKSHTDKLMVIGRMNYLGTHSRQATGIWTHLKAIYVFDRYVDYRTPYRTDGKFHVGALCTGWFLFDMAYNSLPTISVLDVQEFASLGAFREP